MEQVAFGVHTGVCKHVISRKESNTVKGFFNRKADEPLKDEMCFYEKGVTKIWIEEIPNKNGIRFYLHIKINFSRTLGIGNHKIMPWTAQNMRQSFKAINKVLKLLPLLDNNNRFSDWTVERLDTAFDVFEPRTTLLMKLLNQSLDLGNKKKKCERIEIQGKTPEQLLYESIRFGNKSFVYNIYNKLIEVFAKAKQRETAVTPEDLKEVRGILRIERQNYIDRIKKFLPTHKAGDLLKEDVRNHILQTMVDEMEMFFGRGDYYSSGKDSKTFPVAKDVFNKISPVEIDKEDVEQYGVDFMECVYNRVIKAYPRPPDKRQYHTFPVPHRTGDGRMSVNISLYSVNGKRTITVAGKTLEDTESKVLRKLKEVYLANRLYLKSDDSDKWDMVLKSADAVKRFHRTAKTAAVKQEAGNFIKSVIQIDEERFSDCPSATGGG